MVCVPLKVVRFCGPLRYGACGGRMSRNNKSPKDRGNVEVRPPQGRFMNHPQLGLHQPGRWRTSAPCREQACLFRTKRYAVHGWTDAVCRPLFSKLRYAAQWAAYGCTEVSPPGGLAQAPKGIFGSPAGAWRAIRESPLHKTDRFLCHTCHPEEQSG